MPDITLEEDDSVGITAACAIETSTPGCQHAYRMINEHEGAVRSCVFASCEYERAASDVK